MLALVAGGLQALGAMSGSGTPPDETVPDLGPDPLEQAIAVVEEFALAWNERDSATVTSAIAAERPGSIVLPGLMYPRFGPPLEPGQLADAVAFLTGIARISLGRCEAEPAPADLGETVVVRCGDARFEGDYVEALRRAAPEDADPEGITFAVLGTRIVAISASGGSYDPAAYCVWAEQDGAGLALFDLHCHPTTTAASAGSHARTAAAFMAAGGPVPVRETIDARLVATFVDLFVDRHNAGRPLAALPWLSPEVSARDLPGFAGAARDPDIRDYLLWSARLLRIELGECSVEMGGRFTTVTCPDLTVAGPLLDGPHPQPTRFTLAASASRNLRLQPVGVITDIEPLGGRPLPLEAICRRLQQSDPAAAALAFTEDCSPVYTTEAAAVLVAAFGPMSGSA